MKLEGSCHCGAVRFSVDSSAPYPYMRCYCSVCRKTAGGGGYAINLGADSGSLRIEGEENLSVYRVASETNEDGMRQAQRHFARLAARRSGSMTRVGPSWSIPSHRLSIRSYPPRPKPSISCSHRRPAGSQPKPAQTTNSLMNTPRNP